MEIGLDDLCGKPWWPFGFNKKHCLTSVKRLNFFPNGQQSVHQFSATIGPVFSDNSRVFRTARSALFKKYFAPINGILTAWPYNKILKPFFTLAPSSTNRSSACGRSAVHGLIRKQIDRIPDFWFIFSFRSLE